MVSMVYLLNMKKQKNINNKVKITISVNPIIYNRMETELVNKSRLIENLLFNYYEKKDMYKV